MIAPATRANLLDATIDKAAILASYEQGLFTVGHLRVLLDNYVTLQQLARGDDTDLGETHFNGEEDVYIPPKGTEPWH